MRVIWIILMCVWLVGCATHNEVVGYYDVSKLPSDFGGEEPYLIGANEDGLPVFLDPDAAFRQALIDYKEGFKAIQKEYYLLPITKWTWKNYGIYGWQITHEDPAIIDQGFEISRFFKIYQNSF